MKKPSFFPINIMVFGTHRNVTSGSAMQIAIRYVWPAYLRDRLFGIICCLFAVCGLTGISSDVHAIEEYTAHGGPVKHLDLSPDGRLMVSASFDYSAVMWSLPEFDEAATLIGHDAAVNIARFSPDGRWLVTGGDDNQVLLWLVADVLANPEDVEAVKLTAHKGKIVGLNFSSDSKFLISSSWDGTAMVWDMARAAEGEASPVRLDGHEGPVNAAAFSEDGKFVYTAGYDGHIRYWRLSDKTFLRSIIRNGWGVNVMYVDETDGLIAYGTTDGAMVIHDLGTDKELVRMGDERVPVLSVAISPDKSQIGFGNAKGMVKIIDMASMSLLRDFKAANGPIWSLLLMPQAGDMVVASLDDHISKWQIQDFPPEILDSPGPARRFHPTAEISNGERQFARKCSVCHTLEADGRRRAGPTLFGVFGRRAGSLPDYPYSQALLDSDIIWSAESVARLFTDGPDVVTPGTKMPIQRMKNKQDRDDLIAYLLEVTQEN
ncbi:MAG: c-type cytochrome [Candidatus Puniceispirillaceae bacterium]